MCKGGRTKLLLPPVKGDLIPPHREFGRVFVLSWSVHSSAGTVGGIFRMGCANVVVQQKFSAPAAIFCVSGDKI